MNNPDQLLRDAKHVGKDFFCSKYNTKLTINIYTVYGSQISLPISLPKSLSLHLRQSHLVFIRS